MSEDNQCILTFDYEIRFSRSALNAFDTSYEKHCSTPHQLGNEHFGITALKKGSDFDICFWAHKSDDVQASRILPGNVRVTAMNSTPSQNFFSDVDWSGDDDDDEDDDDDDEHTTSVACHSSLVMSWSSNTVSDLENGGWLTKRGVMKFRVEVFVYSHTWKQCPTLSDWSPGVCVNKLWQAREFADFTIIVHDRQEIQCHRAVLSAASPVFKGMMSGDWEESMQTLERLDVSVKDMSLLLEYIYVGHLPADLDCITLMRLTEMADYYQLPGLIHHCVSRIPSLVCEENIIEVLSSLSVLSQTNPKLEDALHSVMDEVKSDEKLLYVVCTSVKKLITEGPDTSEDKARLDDTTCMPTTLDSHALLEHQNSTKNPQHSQNEEEAHYDGSHDTSGVSCQSHDASLTSKCPSIGRRSVFSCPPGLCVARHPDSTEATLCHGDATVLDDNVDVAGSSGNPMPPVEEPPAQTTSAQAACSAEPPVDECGQQSGPRRKTRRGGTGRKRSAHQDQMDLSSIPGTHNSWD